MSFCYGIFAKILTFCKPKKTSPTNKELHEKLFSSVCDTYTNIHIADYTSSRLLKCDQNVPPEVTQSARKIIQEEKTWKATDYFRTKIIDSQMIRNDEQTVLAIVSMLLDVISKDASISEDTKVELVTGSTKKELLTQKIFILPDFLAGLFLYAVTVDNRKGQELSSELNYENFLAYCSKENMDLKIVNSIDDLRKSNDPVITLMPELDPIISQCNRALRDSQRKIHVYSWNELDFESVYVTPELVQMERRQKHEFPIIGIDFGSSTIAGRSIFHSHFISYREYISSIYNTMPIDLMETPSKATIFHDFEVPKILSTTGKNYLNVLPETNFFRKTLGETLTSSPHASLIRELFMKDDIVYIVGGAGYGKSLFLKGLCVNPYVLYGFREKPLLIIYGDIKRMIKRDGTFRPMTDFLEECFINGSLVKPDELYPNLIVECLREKKCLVLLDALDEIGNDQREKIHHLIINYFMLQYPGNKVCITSRERGFIPHEDITWYRINPITLRDAGEYIDRFIELDKFEESEKQRFLKQAGHLINNQFVNGFLTLSLLLAIYKNEEELPASKIALYQKCFEYIAFSREQNKKLLINSYTNEPYDWKILAKFMADATFMELTQLGKGKNIDLKDTEIEKLLSELYRRSFDSTAEFKNAVQMFLQFCSNRTEVFIPASAQDTRYKFFHRSFYEYFYSEYIVFRTKSVEETYQKLFCFGVDSEAFELTAALYQQKNPNYLVDLILYVFMKMENYRIDSDIYVKTFDILIMLMQTIDDKTLIHRFIKYFLENAENISRLPLMTNFGMIYNVFRKEQKYFTKQFHSDNMSLFQKIQKLMENYLMKSIAHCGKILIDTGNIHVTFHEITSQKGIHLPLLLFLLPHPYGILMDWMKKLANKDIGNPVSILERDMDNDLCSFANFVLHSPLIKQIDVYHAILVNA